MLNRNAFLCCVIFSCTFAVHFNRKNAKKKFFVLCYIFLYICCCHFNLKKILHNTIKYSCSIILIEMATANVQENITQHKKNMFFSIILLLFWPFFPTATDFDSSYPWICLTFMHLMGVRPVQTYCWKKCKHLIYLAPPTMS